MVTEFYKTEFSKLVTKILISLSLIKFGKLCMYVSQRINFSIYNFQKVKTWEREKYVIKIKSL